MGLSDIDAEEVALALVPPIDLIKLTSFPAKRGSRKAAEDERHRLVEAVRETPQFPRALPSVVKNLQFEIRSWIAWVR